MDRHINELRDSFPWGELTGTIVDVGGGSGHISIALAKVSTLSDPALENYCPDVLCLTVPLKSFSPR